MIEEKTNQNVNATKIDEKKITDECIMASLNKLKNEDFPLTHNRDTRNFYLHSISMCTNDKNALIHICETGRSVCYVSYVVLGDFTVFYRAVSIQRPYIAYLAIINLLKRKPGLYASQ